MNMNPDTTDDDDIDTFFIRSAILRETRASLVARLDFEQAEQVRRQEHDLNRELDRLLVKRYAERRKETLS